MMDSPRELVIGAAIVGSVIVAGILYLKRRDSKKPEHKSPGGYDVEDDGC